MQRIGENDTNIGLLSTHEMKSRKNESLEYLKVSPQKLKYYTHEDPTLKNLKSKINNSNLNINNEMETEYLKYH